MMPWLGVVPLLPALWLAAGDAADGAPTVDVRAPGVQCPSPAEVAQRIGPLLPARTGFQSSDCVSREGRPNRPELTAGGAGPSQGSANCWIELTEVPSRRPGAVDVEVRLARAGVAAPLGVRRIERRGTCNEVADAVAVVAATWISEFALPAPAVPPLPAPDPGTGSPPVESTPAAARPATTTPAATLARTAAIETPTGSAFALGGFGGALTGGQGGVTGLFGLEGELRRPVLLARLAVAATGTRELSLAGGRASWQRIVATIAVGTDLWRGRRAFLDATLGPMLALITARGINLETTSAPTGVDVGIAPAVRVGRLFFRESVAGWVAAGGALWLRDRILAVDGAPETRTLPRFEVEISAGLTFFLGS